VSSSCGLLQIDAPERMERSSSTATVRGVRERLPRRTEQGS